MPLKKSTNKQNENHFLNLKEIWYFYISHLFSLSFWWLILLSITSFSFFLSFILSILISSSFSQFMFSFQFSFRFPLFSSFILLSPNSSVVFSFFRSIANFSKIPITIFLWSLHRSFFISEFKLKQLTQNLMTWWVELILKEVFNGFCF